MHTSGPGGTPPLVDYDRLTAGEPEHRVRPLSASEIEGLTRYEDQHAARRPVLELLRARAGQLAGGE